MAKEHLKLAFITTVYNEEKKIELLLQSLQKQTRKPDEIIIVDGGSQDNTIRFIKEWIKELKSEEFKKKIRLIIEKGNRSQGRNTAIKKSRSEIVVSSDSGCILDKNWIRNIIKPFKNDNVDVVAGFYKGLPNSIFQKSLTPYVLVMPDRVNPKNFLPAARSMAFRKSIWKKVGGFPREYSNNEDYIFAKRLKKLNTKIVFKRDAIVYWIPRGNIFEAFIMFFRFATGDAESGILRPKALLIIIRYVLFFWLLIYSLIFNLFFIVKFIAYILLTYIAWSIWKNYKYVKRRKALFFLPLIQFTSDIAIICGTTFGFFKTLWDTQKKR